MEVADGRDRLGADEGHVATEDEEVLGERACGLGEVCLEHLDGVTGTLLLGLEDELDAGRGDGGTDTPGLMTDDAEDAGRRHDLAGGCDDVEQEGLAADLMQDLGALAVEAGAFACCHDCDCETFPHCPSSDVPRAMFS